MLLLPATMRPGEVTAVLEVRKRESRKLHNTVRALEVRKLPNEAYTVEQAGLEVAVP